MCHCCHSVFFHPAPPFPAKIVVWKSMEWVFRSMKNFLLLLSTTSWGVAGVGGRAVANFNFSCYCFMRSQPLPSRMFYRGEMLILILLSEGGKVDSKISCFQYFSAPFSPALAQLFLFDETTIDAKMLQTRKTFAFKSILNLRFLPLGFIRPR